ncbi:hypothetical protein B0H16DRAFT_1690876 [Mycena metata]|uniref:Uncharacterized protein n=1 Tax=Mycena metata TaxID=1033252 RepID=A0AAD7IYU5_9AGAR|nr:hypothetical protein B0H16DRAFT_1690876 [Mycena metata]
MENICGDLSQREDNAEEIGWTSWLGQVGPPEHLNEVPVELPQGLVYPDQVAALEAVITQWRGLASYSVYDLSASLDPEMRGYRPPDVRVCMSLDPEMREEPFTGCRGMRSYTPGYKEVVLRSAGCG